VVLTTAAVIDKSNPWLRSRTGKGTEEYRGRRYTLDSDGWTAIFVSDDHTLVFGSRAAVRLVIDRLVDPKSGPLDSAIRAAADDPKRVVIGAQGPKFRRLLADNLPQDMQLAAPAYTADRVTIAIDFRDGLTIDSVGEFATEAAAKEGHTALVKAFAVGAKEFTEVVRKLPTQEEEKDAERADEQKQHRDFLTQTRDAFQAAKTRSLARLSDSMVSRFPTPWAWQAAEEARALFGPDPWPYGLAANRPTLEAFLGFCFEQGVGARRVAIEDLFLAAALEPAGGSSA
jgi:uncharacterized protein YhfF